MEQAFIILENSETPKNHMINLKSGFGDETKYKLRDNIFYTIHHPCCKYNFLIAHQILNIFVRNNKEIIFFYYRFFHI